MWTLPLSARAADETLPPTIAMRARRLDRAPDDKKCMFHSF
jgi:hypothetical protein